MYKKFTNLDYGQKFLKISKIKKNRESSQPIKLKTGGSTFKNPKKLYAAKLIEESGCKNLRYGDAMVSSKHANFLINIGNASASDIEILGQIVQEKVINKFKIALEWEIMIIGENSD